MTTAAPKSVTPPEKSQNKTNANFPTKMSVPSDADNLVQDLKACLTDASQALARLRNYYAGHEKDESQLDMIAGLLSKAHTSAVSIEWPTTSVSEEWTSRPIPPDPRYAPKPPIEGFHPEEMPDYL